MPIYRLKVDQASADALAKASNGKVTRVSRYGPDLIVETSSALTEGERGSLETLLRDPPIHLVREAPELDKR